MSCSPSLARLSTWLPLQTFFLLAWFVLPQPSRAKAGPQAPPSASLHTTGEASFYTHTGRYDEVIRLCEAFSQRYPAAVRCQRFGQTPEGRPLISIVASQDGTLEPATARVRRRPVVLAQGGIHAGEIEGKDAGFFLLQEMLRGARLPGVLSRVTWVFVPVFNADGHERFGPYHRPNQNGPIETGWRVTAQNLNLNRDYVKAEAKEMGAMLSLLQTWDPILYIDLHTTDGAEFQPDIAVTLEPRLAGPEALRTLGKALSQRVMEALKATGHMPLDFYPSFVRTDDPSSGFANELPSPRFSTGYWPLWNRFAVLVETHSWKPYPHRVRTTVDTLEALLAAAAEQGPAWIDAALAADRADHEMGGTDLPLEYNHGPQKSRLRFPGYAYIQEPSAVSGTMRIRYDVRRREIWDIPFYAEIMPEKPVKVPGGGYVVPPAYAELVGEKLRRHGLSSERLVREVALPASEAEVFHISEHSIHKEPYEGRHPVTVKGEWHGQAMTLLTGSLLVPTAQRGGKLVVHLLEPTGPDSLLTWGFMSGIFEQKEYMEEYVAEQVAQEMMSRDAILRDDFLRKLREEPAFARDPKARLSFFYRRHPSYDTRQDVYPVLRIHHVLKTQ